MTIKEIKQAIEDGKKVYQHNLGYEVILDSIGQYLIHCNMHNTYIGLHGVKGGKYENQLNGNESDFFIVE